MYIIKEKVTDGILVVPKMPNGFLVPGQFSNITTEAALKGIDVALNNSEFLTKCTTLKSEIIDLEGMLGTKELQLEAETLCAKMFTSEEESRVL